MKRLRELVRRWLGDPRLRATLAGAAGAAVVLIGVGAQAAGGSGEPHLNVWGWEGHAPPVGWAAINLAVFVGVVAFLAGPAIKKIFVRRHEEVKALLDSSQAALRAAKAEQEEYEHKLANVETDTQLLRDGARREGAQDRERIIAAATEYAARLRKDTEAAVQQEAANARRRLKTELVEEVLRDAEALLRKTLSAEDQERLVDQVIAELEQGGEESFELRRAV